VGTRPVKVLVTEIDAHDRDITEIGPGRAQRGHGPHHRS